MKKLALCVIGALKVRESITIDVEYKSQVCNNVSDVMKMQNKTCYIVTVFCFENLFLEVTMYVTL